MDNNLIVWFILFFVFSMLLYPIVQIIPSTRLRNKISLREYTVSLGIRIDVRSPKIEKDLDILYGDLIATVGYHLEYHNHVYQKRHTALRSLKHDNWFWINDSQPPVWLIEKLQAAYQTLPTFIEAVEHGPNGTTIFCRESQSKEDVDRIYAVLKSLNQISR